MTEPVAAPRVFISYAHYPDDHCAQVRALWALLEQHEVDVRIDMAMTGERYDFTLWMEEQVAQAEYVLVIASPEYKKRAGHAADPDVGRGVQWEARLIRNLYYGDQSGLRRFLPVVLPEGDPRDVPTFLTPDITTIYQLSALTAEGAAELLAVLRRRPAESACDQGRPTAVLHLGPHSATHREDILAALRNRKITTSSAGADALRTESPLPTLIDALTGAVGDALPSKAQVRVAVSDTMGDADELRKALRSGELDQLLERCPRAPLAVVIGMGARSRIDRARVRSSFSRFDVHDVGYWVRVRGYDVLPPSCPEPQTPPPVRIGNVFAGPVDAEIIVGGDAHFTAGGGSE